MTANSRGRRLKSVSLLLGILFSGAALLAWSQPWFVATLGGASATHPPIPAGGDVAAPAVAALALAGLAGVGAMAISGRVFRIVLALLQVLVGGCIVLSASLALLSPVSAVEPLVTTATGIAGHEAVSALVAAVPATAWPFVAFVAGLLLAVLGLSIVVTGRVWPGSSGRYQPVRFEAADAAADPRPAGGEHAVSDWDALSGGADPTSGEPRSGSTGSR
ncbi:hypothetical protein GCM10022239_21340 [Leifsonia bigeumensis]|uniref:Trp biosynthesis-associated membrane protein n=1 Tax=Leifsonella bigeumensis TaxID=433643 RepID=A0ABP7FVK7_9MICO